MNKNHVLNILLILLLIGTSFTAKSQIKIFKDFYNDESVLRYGFVNESGDTIIPPTYDFVNSYFNTTNFAIVGRGDYYGIVNSQGKEIIAVEYDYIFLQKEYIFVVKNNKWGLYNSNGDLLIKPKYGFLGVEKEGLIRANKGGKASYSDNGLILNKHFEIGGGKWGYIDISGKVIIPFIYTYAYDFDNEVAKVYVGGKNDDWLYNGVWNFVDRNNKLIIPKSLSGQDDFTNGLMIVSKEDKVLDEYDDYEIITKYGLINSKGEIVLKPEYHVISFINKNLISIQKEYSKPYQILRYDLSQVIDADIESIKVSGYTDTILFLRIKGLWAIIGTSGNIIVPPTFSKIETDNPQNEIVYMVQKPNKQNKNLWGIIHINGKEILPAEYEEIRRTRKIYGNNNFLVKKNNKWGRVDKNNQQIIPFEYDDLQATQITYNGQNVYLVSKEDKWGLIDNKNNVLIDLIFDSLPNNYDIQYGFRRNVIKAKYQGNQVIIDAKGNIKYPSKFSYVEYIEDNWKQNIVEVSENGKFGITDTLANIIIPIKYDNFHFIDNYLLAENNSKFYLIDINSAKEIMEFDEIFRSLLFFKNDNLICPLKKDNKWVFINISKGELYSDLQFDELPNDDFYCGVNRVKINNKYGLINEEIKLVIPAEYDEMITRACSIDANGVSKMNIEARKGKYWGILNKDGSIIKEFKYKKRQY